MSEKMLVITGGSRGIGRAAIARFQAEGFSVINLSRTPIGLAGVAQITVDMSDANWAIQGAGKLHDAVVKRMPSGQGRIVVVHNAGLLEKDSVCTVAAESFAKVMQVNVIAPAQLNQILLPIMTPGSAIVYVGSTLSEKAVANSCSYVTSKHALVGLMRATCQDLVGSGIHTNCVCPGFTDTEMLRAHVGGDQAVLDSIASGVTFNRLIQPQEMADAIYVAATQAVFNGAVMHANLGQIER
ncbi:SDR family oxidoreductase [Simiduia litorea]|uniref:SDR family NAD(P)-dependent oxidoreductase n=1 Tax=Simiduia litorea TaxID=1435348 RepID=UPI0036F2A199